MPRSQAQITAVLTRLFGKRVDPVVDQWATAHGDLRWTNLTTLSPYLLDWEFWGAAPLGADAATLYCSSLLTPVVAARVHQTFADLLDTRSGRLSQLCVIAQLLRHPDRPDTLARELQRLVDKLLP